MKFQLIISIISFFCVCNAGISRIKNVNPQSLLRRVGSGVSYKSECNNVFTGLHENRAFNLAKINIRIVQQQLFRIFSTDVVQKYVGTNEDHEFFESIIIGDKATFMHHIDAGVNINQVSRDGFSPLWYAVMHKQVFMCRVLLQKGADMFLGVSKYMKSPFEMVMLYIGNASMIQVFRSHILELYKDEFKKNYESDELIKMIVENEIEKFHILIPDHESLGSIIKFDTHGRGSWDLAEENALNLRNSNLTKSINYKYGDRLRIALLYALREEHYAIVYKLMRYKVVNYFPVTYV